MTTKQIEIELKILQIHVEILIPCLPDEIRWEYESRLSMSKKIKELKEQLNPNKN